MSVIVSKFGGTSNATPEAYEACLEQSEGSQIVVTSAPGRLSAEQVADFPVDVAGGVNPNLLGEKVTNLSLMARIQFEESHGIPESHINAIQARFAAIARGAGNSSLSDDWVDRVPDRLKTAIQLGADYASMIGEVLMAEIYEAEGFKYLNPGTSPHSLVGSDAADERDLWKGWLSTAVQPGQRHILPGNITYNGANLIVFGPGGSDISGADAAYAMGADVYQNMTDTSAQSVDPRILPDPSRRRHLDYLTYAEGRELGRNGVGLLHPRAIVPLMGSGIPTEIRNTFDPDGDYTQVADELNGGRREMSIAAISLIPNVQVIRVHEPGRSEVIGWAAEHDSAISLQGVNLIDTIGDGADSHIFIVDGADGQKTQEAIKSLGRKRSEISAEERAFVTLVGHDIGRRKLDILNRLALNTNLGRRDQHGQVIFADHSVRLTLEPSKAPEFVDMAHNFFIEREY